MTSMVLLVRATVAELQRPVRWARTGVRLLDSELAGWTLADVGEPNQAALERVAEESSAIGPALLVVMGAGLVGLGAFVLDPVAWHGRLHDVATGVTINAALLAR